MSNETEKCLYSNLSFSSTNLGLGLGRCLLFLSVLLGMKLIYWKSFLVWKFLISSCLFYFFSIEVALRKRILVE